MRCSASPYAAIQAGRKEPQMIILGIVLIVVGLLVKSLAVLVTIGIILLVVGVILAILGGMGRPVGGRKHYYCPGCPTTDRDNAPTRPETPTTDRKRKEPGDGLGREAEQQEGRSEERRVGKECRSR